MTMMTKGEPDWDVVGSLHDGPNIPSKEHLQFLCVFVGGVTALLNVVFLGVFAILWSFGYGKNTAEKPPASASNKTSKGKAATLLNDHAIRACLRGSYMISSFLMNALVSWLGLYHMLHTIEPNVSVEQRVQGYEAIAVLPALHIAYQLWALPVGIFFVDESPAMLLHHVAVCCAASLCTFFTNGFRYSNPFFYGIVEFSSLPLGVMNFFKENRSWIIAHPDTYTLVRLVFAISFLWFRVVMWLPRIHDVLTLSSMLLWTCSSMTCRLRWGIFVSSAMVLTLLQLFWAQKIVAGVLKVWCGAKNRTGILTKPTGTDGYGSEKRKA